ncbi:MAG: beta-N-acetylglucosaminidase [Planctomycetes bacterium B3_Pla]|nr:MAG: beta-N-acetylglucosaminidase [Planctomycetes bacterium B3_Pla]
MINKFSLKNVVRLLVIVAGTAAGSHGQTVSVIPKPVSIEYLDGFFTITRSTRVIAENDAAAEASKLIDALAPAMGFRLQRAIASQRRDDAIKLELNGQLSQLSDEGYELDVSAEQVVIRARREGGLFHGIQTVLQLLPATVLSKARVENVTWNVPCVKIVDYPRFQWRGLLVDPARHFIPMEDLLRFIDTMALHKFNSLQIHLTDDQGWRIEIRKYPKLTETGALMDFTTMRQGDTEASRKRPGGYYTQEDVRRLVRYAAERYITIVPEIEMPAHTGGAIVSYPQIGLYPRKLSDLAPSQRWKANERVLAPRPETVAFMQDVLLEVMELFPGRYIHIGGDEANTGHWKKSEEMQALQQRLDLTDEAELHSWFIKQMDTFLTRHSRRLVGWDEILQGGLAPGATVMSWRGEQGGITAANAGHDVVMAPTSHTYFDYYQGPAEQEPRAIGGNLPLEKVYGFEPVPEAVAAEKTRHILGVQGQLWGEYISTAEHREYMAYPRAAALAEVGWSPKASKDYESFLARLSRHLDRLKVMGVNYRKPD